MKTLAAALCCLIAISVSRAAVAQEQKNCQLGRYARFDMALDDTGRVSVPMTINGKTINLLVDTGGWISTLTASTAADLGLSTQTSHGVYGVYYGGEVVNQYVVVHDAVFGTMKAPELTFFVMSDQRISVDEGGTLSPDIMGQFDVEFDFANGELNFYSQDHCEGQVVYWAHNYARVPFDFDDNHHIRIQIQLDGKVFNAGLDTGAADSVGSLEAVEDEFHLKRGVGDLKLITEPSDKVHAYQYHFKSLNFEGVTDSNPDIILRPDDESHMPHAFLIGMNILRHLHIYIAYKEKALYITPATAH